jgi:transmembrane sensor
MSEQHLTPQQGAQLQQWLESHPLNAAALEEVITTWRAVETHAATPDLITLRRQALALGQRSKRWRSARAFLKPSLTTALAASLLLALFGGALWWTLRMPTLATDIGERRIATLTDGSRVSLDAATQLGVDFTQERRHLVLKGGRAKFDVAKNALRPFSVDAGDKTIVAMGTSFSVELLNHQVRVVLYDGRISVLDRASPATPASAAEQATATAGQLLAPGHILVASDQGPAREIPIPDTARSLSWEGGLLAFDDEPLSTAIERINRYTDKHIRIADPAVGELKVSGLFAAGDIQAFLEGIHAAFPVQVRDVPNGIELQAAPSNTK